MSNLGTLSFDVDLDLSKLKSKIDTQNKAIKDALEGLQVKVATKSVGELAQQIQSELNNHQFAIKLDEAKLSGLKSDIVSIAEKSKEIAENFARMGQGGGGTQQAVNIDLSKFNGISEIIEKIEGEMKRLYNVFADTTDGSGKQVAGLITNLSLLKDALEQLGTAAKNFTPTQQLNEAATAAQNVATATQNAAKVTKTASDEEAEATKKANIERERQLKLIAEVQAMLSKIGGISSENTGLNPQRINEVKQAYEGMLNSLSTIPPSKSLQELSAELATLKANTKGFFQEVSQSQKAVESIRLVRYALKQVNEQMASGNTSPKLEGFREQLQAINREMHNLMKAGNLDGIQTLFAGHKGMSDGVVSIIRQMVTEMKKLGVATQETAGITSHLSAEEQKLAQSIQQSTNSMRGQSQILSDLKTMAMQYLSVWGAQSFIHNIIQTGGLLEQQRMSIGAILGDLSQANHLFGQIQQLALKSPFGVVQLDTMSKQLTAYNFKYSELYDWTKRLADISAATGTEVSRLSLALGHVRSEGALSGYTLRQFAMGNVPLLQTLAQQLGKTTSEIRKMTREKAITYDDVEKALRTLTDEGGIFFNAQEVMSNALNAKFKNMYDAFDIMFGKMAESGVGDVLKKVAETMTVLAKNWEQTGAVILSVAGYLAVHKAAMIASNKAMIQANLQSGRFTAAQLEMQAATGNLNKQMLLQAVAAKKMSVADAEAAAATLGLSRAQLQHVANTGKVTAAYNMATIATSKYTVQQLRLLATFRAGSWTSWTTWLNGLKVGWMGVSAAAKVAGTAIKGFFAAAWPMLAISAAVEAITYFVQKAGDAKDRVKDLMQTANEGFKSLEKSAQQFKIGASVTMDDKLLEESIKEMDEILKSYLPQDAHGTLNEAFRIDPETGKSVHSLKEQYEMLAEQLDVTRDAYKELGKINDSIEVSNDETDGWFDESFRQNTEDYIKALKKREKAETDFIANNRVLVAGALDETRKKYILLDGEIRRSIEAFEKTEGKTGFAADDLKAQLEVVNKYSDTSWHFIELIQNSNEKSAESWMKYESAVRNVGIAHKEMTDDLEVFSANLSKRLKAIYGEDVSKWTEAQKLAVQKSVELFMTGIDGYSDMAENERIEIEKKLLAPYNIPINVDAREANKALTEMQAYLNDLVGKDWVVTLKLQNVGSFTDLYDQLDKDVKASMDTMKKLGDGISDERKKVLQTAMVDVTQLTAKEKEYHEAWLNGEHAKQTAQKEGFKLSSLEKQNANDKKKEETAANKAQREAINNIKEQIEEVKKFYAEYKKYSKVYGEEKGQSMVEELFGIDHQRANEIIADYKGMLETLAKQLEANKDKKGALSVRQFIAELDLNDAKEIAESTLNKLGKELEAQAKRWDLYKKILDATGNKEQASTIAFGKLINFDNFGQDLRDQITKALESVPKAKGKSIDELLDMDQKQLEKLDIFKDSTNNIYNLLEKLRDAEQSLKAEEVDLFLNALNNAKSLETELEQIRLKYDKTREAINKADNLSSEQKSSLLANTDKNQAIEEANKQWEWFKKNTEGWGEMFGNMDRMTTQAIEDMIQKLEKFIPNVQGSEEAIKAVYEALDKMHKAVSSRNPFKGLVDSVSKVSKLRELLKYMNDNNLSNFNAGVWGAKKFGLVEGQTYSKEQIANLIKGATDDFNESLKGVQATFAALQDVLNPVIELFEVLGNTDLSRFFQIGSNALGSAASAASGITSLSGLFSDKSKIGQFLGDAAPYVAGAAAGLSVISSLIAMHDQALQEEIDASKARVKVIENLSKGLEKAFERTLNAIQNAKPSEKESETLTKYLNAYKYLAAGSLDPFNLFRSQYGYIQDDTAKAIEKALESDSYYNTKLAELYIQRDEISKQLAAEKDKKDSDAGAIADYEAQLEDLNDQIKNFAIDMAKALYDIDIKSWASELTDAVVEAWENGEDAVDAYEKKVKDMMKDLLKTILAQHIMEEAFKNAEIPELITSLMTGSSGDLDENAVIQIADALGTASEGGTKAIIAILDKLEELGYISKAEAEEAAANIDTIKNAFSDLLSDPTQDIEEWGKNFRNSLIQELVKNMLLGEEFEKWAADWNERVTNLWNAYNNNEISKDAFDEGMAGLYQEFDNTANDLTARGKKFYEDLGYVFDEAESEGIFDGLSDSWVSTLMDMSKTAEDWANEVGKTVAEQIIKQMVVPTMIQPLIDNLQEVFKSAMEAATTTDDEGNTSYDWEAVLNNQGLTAALNALSEKYPKIQEVVKHIMDALNLDTSNYKYDGFSNLADSIIDSLKSADGSLESWAAEQGKKMAEQMAKAYADTEYGDRIKQLNDEWQQALKKNDVARMEEIRKELEKLYAEMGKNEKLKGLIEDFKELGTTVTSLSDSFVSSLMDMSKTAEDWAQDLGKTIAEAIIKATVVPTLIQPLLQNVQDVFDSVIESATSLDADGKKVVDWKTVINDEGLMAAIQNVVDQYPELQSVIEKIMSAFGLKLHDNPFADMASTFTSSLMDMEASAESFGREISRMLTEQMINKVITEQFQSQIDALGEQWRTALDNQDAAAIENIKNQLVALREQMGEAVQPLLDAISDIEKQADTTFSSMTDSWVSALMDMEGSAEDWAESVGKTMAQKIITEMIAPMYLQPVLDAMQKAWDGVMARPGATIRDAIAAMTPFLESVKGVYNELSPLIQEVLNSFGIYADTVEEAVDEVEYALQDLKSTFVSSLMDMTNSAEDFSKDISKIMAEAFIKKFILGDAFDAQMKIWQERFEGILTSGMSEEERKRQLKKLREEIVAYQESEREYANTILDLFGLGASSQQEATMNMADKITYDQADQLLGINLAQELTLEQILATLRGDSLAYTPMFDSLTGASAVNDEQSKLMLATMQNMAAMMQDRQDGILTQVAMANSHLQLIRDYSKSIRDEVVMHLGSMDSKLSYLRSL